MSRKRKPQTRRKPKAALTQRQRHRLNDIRPTVPHDYPNQGAQPLITTRAQGKQIRDAVRSANVVQDLEAQIDGPATRRGPKRRLSVEALTGGDDHRCVRHRQVVQPNRCRVGAHRARCRHRV